MEKTFELYGRTGVRSTKNWTIAAYTGESGAGIAYLGLPPRGERKAVVQMNGEKPFFGVAKDIEPFGGDNDNNPNLRLTCEGAYKDGEKLPTW